MDEKAAAREAAPRQDTPRTLGILRSDARRTPGAPAG